MYRWITIVSLFTLAYPVRASDGPIDWTKAPGGGPTTLRNCAQYAYNDNARGGGSVNVFLGCTKNSCVCRTDLVEKAHQHIKDIVVLNCGDDSSVDVDAATKIYDDYCAAAGYPIPGYVYVITQTVQALPGDATATAHRDASIIQANGGVVTVTAEANSGVVTVTAEATATVTVIRSSASPPTLRPCVWLYGIVLLALIPVKTILALPQTMVVIITSTPLAPAITSVVTVKASPSAAGPAFSTKYVQYSSQQVRIPSANNPASSDSSSNPDSSANNPSGATKKDGRSKLEIAGIIIGIIVGILTTIATIWMCARGNHRSGGNAPPPAPVVRRGGYGQSMVVA